MNAVLLRLNRALQTGDLSQRFFLSKAAALHHLFSIGLSIMLVVNPADIEEAKRQINNFFFSSHFLNQCPELTNARRLIQPSEIIAK